jgi:hypothetical protein
MTTTRGARGAVLFGLLGLSFLAAAVLPPIPQDPAYHRMADARRLLGIPNALNVVSNAAFVVAGALGAWNLRPGSAGGRAFLDSRERWPWRVFFAGLALTGVGSGYYHLAPDSTRLVWDRLPLAVALMALLAAVITERIGAGIGLSLLGPMVAIGVGSVLFWHAGEARGHGDLRLYALVQFFPLLAVPLILGLWPPRYTLGAWLVAAVAVYGVAKLFEWLDRPVLAASSTVSGHTLKHLVAGAAGYVLVRMLARRRPLSHALSEGT